jgi:hypothetical protein
LQVVAGTLLPYLTANFIQQSSPSKSICEAMFNLPDASFLHPTTAVFTFPYRPELITHVPYLLSLLKATGVVEGMPSGFKQWFAKMT